MVFDLSSKGYNQNRISAILHVSQALVSLDLAALRRDAANSMKSYLEEKLPLIYQECYEGISQVISRSWEMINDVNTPTQTRVQLLALVADATQTKLDISCGGEVIENGIKYAQNVKSKFVAIAKPEADEMLHSSSSTNNEEEAVSAEEEQSSKKEEDDNLAIKNNNKEEQEEDKEQESNMDTNTNTDNNSNSNNNSNNNNNNRRTRNSVF
jgi:hypothetical protein